MRREGVLWQHYIIEASRCWVIIIFRQLHAFFGCSKNSPCVWTLQKVTSIRSCHHSTVGMQCFLNCQIQGTVIRILPPQYSAFLGFLQSTWWLCQLSLEFFQSFVKLTYCCKQHHKHQNKKPSFLKGWLLCAQCPFRFANSFISEFTEFCNISRHIFMPCVLWIKQL